MTGTRIVVLMLAFDVTASAQERPLTPAEQTELASIDMERDAGHALYVVAPLATLGGGAMVFGAVMISVGCVFADPEGAPDSPCRDQINGVAGAGGTLAILGVLSIIPAVILDVHSGRRRRRLYEGEFTLGLGPTPGGLNLALAGRF